MQKFEPRSRVGIFRNEHTRSKLTFSCISYYLGAFETVWLRYETRCKAGRTSAKVRATKSRRNFSQRRHPIQIIGFWILNSCPGAFRNVWVHLGPFRYCTKLSPNWVELVQLMQKFVQRSRVGIFRNEGTQSMLLNPRLMFWCVL